MKHSDNTSLLDDIFEQASAQRILDAIADKYGHELDTFMAQRYRCAQTHFMDFMNSDAQPCASPPCNGNDSEQPDDE